MSGLAPPSCRALEVPFLRVRWRPRVADRSRDHGLMPLTAFALALTMSGPSPARNLRRTLAFNASRLSADSSSYIGRSVLLVAPLSQ